MKKESKKFKTISENLESQYNSLQQQLKDSLNEVKENKKAISELKEENMKYSKRIVELQKGLYKLENYEEI